MTDLEIKPEKAIAIAVIKKGSDRDVAIEHIEELKLLAETAGAEVVDVFTQELDRPNVATLIGSGKVKEINEYIKENEIKLVIFDDDLSAMQTRNLDKAFEVKVIDRSGLILDIFATRARSNEAKTQVELAQLQYLMPKLTRMWTHLSKQFGGIGTKGPGETQIETDRRMIKIKIQQLKEKLTDIDKQREIQRKNRNQYPRFALVGYTNSGKSTLMRTLTESDVYVADKLFATLDTTVRQIVLNSGMKALLSDTVGFIRKLPTNLVASFRSTLAEAKEADVLIHVVDVSNPYFRDHIKTVDETLESLKITDKPIILALNKIDAIEDKFDYMGIEKEYSNAIHISALRGINIRNLLEKMQNVYNQNSNSIELHIPYSKMELTPYIYNGTEIIEKNEDDLGINFKVRIKSEDSDYFRNIYNNYILN